MDNPPTPPNEPGWLDEFERMANEQLSQGSACAQIHPVVAKWYGRLRESEPPASRDSVLQAIACLATEILQDAPEDVMKAVTEHVSEDELSMFIEYVLMIGRAFEASLRSGELDDL